MADNTVLNTGAGGDTIATDDIAGVKHQMVKLEYGVLDSATLVSTTNPLPVDQTNTTVADGGALPAKGVQVGGTDGSVFQVLSTDAAGRLNTNVNGTIPVSNAGTFAVQDSQKVVDNAGFTDGTTPVQPAGYVFDEVAGTALTENDAAAARIDSKRAQVGVLEDATTRGQRAAVSAAGALKVDGSAVTQPVSGTVTANAGSGTFTVSGTVTANAGTGTLVVDTELPAAAALADAAANPTAPATGAFGMLWNGATWDRAPGGATNGLTTNLKALNGTTVATNSGVKDAGTQRVVIATDQVQLTNALKVDPSAVTSPVSIAASVKVNAEPETAGGLSIFHLVSAATTNATNIKASAGQVYGWYIYNSNAAARKVAFHNTAGTPTAGASISFAIVIPPTSAANVEFTNGIAYATGIAITTVTDLTDAGATAVALNDLIINIFYK